MKEINVYAGIRKYLPYALVFGHNHTVANRAGTVLTSADLYATAPSLFFIVKQNEDDADGDALISHTNEDSAQITVDDTDPLEITVKLERGDTKQSPSIVGNGLFYELTARLADGSYMLFERGRINILESLNDV